MLLAWLLASFQSIPPLPTSKLGPSGADSEVGGLVHVLGTLWISPANSPVRLGVSPAAASTPTGVFSQRFEALFPHAGALGCAVCFVPPPFIPVYLCVNVGSQGLPATTLWGLPAAAWPTPFHNLPSRWVRQLLPCCVSSLPGCPSLPLLPQANWALVVLIPGWMGLCAF